MKRPTKVAKRRCAAIRAARGADQTPNVAPVPGKIRDGDHNSRFDPGAPKRRSTPCLVTAFLPLAGFFEDLRFCGKSRRMRASIGRGSTPSRLVPCSHHKLALAF